MDERPGFLVFLTVGVQPERKRVIDRACVDDIAERLVAYLDPGKGIVCDLCQTRPFARVRERHDLLVAGRVREPLNGIGIPGRVERIEVPNAQVVIVRHRAPAAEQEVSLRYSEGPADAELVVL